MASRSRERSGKAGSSKLLAIEVNGERLTIDTKAMTMRERQLLRRELATIGVEPDTMDWTAGAVWIALRRTDPTITFEDVCDSLTVDDLQGVEMVDADGADPEA